MQCLYTVRQKAKQKKEKDVITHEPVNRDTGTHT